MIFQKNIEALQNLTKPDAVIFDWDNTLVDTWPLIHAAINNAMRFMNQEEWSLQKVKDNVHKSMRESFPALFGDNWQAAGEVYKKSYRDIHLSELRLLPKALQLLEVLQEKNILAFIVSNKIGSTLRKEVQKLSLDNKFFAAIGSTDSSFDKPHNAPVELALLGSKIGAKTHNIWFIGDTIADVDCAYNSGCRPIIYGCDNTISKTISAEVLSGKNMRNESIPLYFNHQTLIDLLVSQA